MNGWSLKKQQSCWAKKCVLHNVFGDDFGLIWYCKNRLCFQRQTLGSEKSILQHPTGQWNLYSWPLLPTYTSILSLSHVYALLQPRLPKIPSKLSVWIALAWQPEQSWQQIKKYGLTLPVEMYNIYRISSNTAQVSHWTQSWIQPRSTYPSRLREPSVRESRFEPRWFWAMKSIKPWGSNRGFTVIGIACSILYKCRESNILM